MSRSSKKAGAVMGIAALSAFLSTVFFGTVAVSAQNNINAVTSASNRLQVFGGKAYATYATIEWQDYYSNGEIHQIRWGTTASYGSSLNLKPFTQRTRITSTIQGLQPGTTYFAEFYRTWPRTQATISTRFQFSTTAATNVLPVSPAHASISIPPKSQAVLFTTTGRMVAALAVDGLRPVSAHFSGRVSPGLYIVRIYDAAGKPVASFPDLLGK
jgi:hypothetical protein